MRRYKVSITHEKQLAFSAEVDATDEPDAVARTWRSYDPGHRYDIFDKAYRTTVEPV